MPDHFEFLLQSDATAVLTRYTGTDKEVRIPEIYEGYPVTAIAEKAFSKNSTLFSVIIPEGVQWIGCGAFSECKSLMFLSLPDSLFSIGEGAFRLCTSLQAILIPDHVQEISSSAFSDCLALQEISLPEGLSRIGAGALRGCRALKEILLPDGVRQIEERTFSGCTSLKHVAFPDKLVQIGDGAFSKCTSLTEAAIPHGVQSIARDAFFACASLASVALPRTLTRIGDRAFYECAALTAVHIPESVSEIGSGAFYGCSALTLVVPPASDAQAYASGRSIPFAHGCVDSLYYNILEDGTAAVIRYAGQSPDVTIPDLLNGHVVSSIGDYAFRFRTFLKQIHVPSSVRTIGAGAFHGCSALSCVHLPQELREIGSDAFKACTSLLSLSFPQSVQHIGGYAFYGCSALTEISLPSGITEIGSFTFCDCTSLSQVALPDHLLKIGTSAFNGCRALAQIRLPEGLAAIASKAFKNCAVLSYIVIPDHVREIGRDAFAGCSRVILHAADNACAQAYAERENIPFISLCSDAEGKPALRGIITPHTEFLSADMPLSLMPSHLHVSSAQNGSIGVQLLFECPEKAAIVRVIGPAFDVQLYQLLEVPVSPGCHSGFCQSAVQPSGFSSSQTCCSAPSHVFDCLQPLESAAVPAINGYAAAYVRFSPKAALNAAEHLLYIEITSGQRTHTCAVSCRVYPVAFDDGLFHMTSRLSIAAMEKAHHVHRGTPEFYAVLRAYARAMRCIHQKIFFLDLHEGMNPCGLQKPYRFDFEGLKPLIEIFLKEGFDTLETGNILCCGFLGDGNTDMDTANLKCSANPSVCVDSREGYELLCCEMQAFSAFLRENNWQDRVLFHIMDEPDAHCPSEAVLSTRRMQYYMASSIVRRYLPGIRIIDAVRTTQMRGGVDVLIPAADVYQQNKAAFDDAATGEEIWLHTRCIPEGKWLHSALNQPLLSSRLLFWGCAANRISGYQHWEFNSLSNASDHPDHAAVCFNRSCDSASLVYSGSGILLASLRLEAVRMGIQEASLLRTLLQKDENAHDALIAQVFRSFNDNDASPETLDQLHEELLRLLTAAQ